MNTASRQPRVEDGAQRRPIIIVSYGSGTPRPRRFSARERPYRPPNGLLTQQYESSRSGRLIDELTVIAIVQQRSRWQLPQRERVREVAADARRVHYQPHECRRCYYC